VIRGDDDYLRDLGEEFEPDTVTLFAQLCAKDARVLDIGANIGMTALALSRICTDGQIVAIEPVPRTFRYLRGNVSKGRARNVQIFNCAVGSNEGLRPDAGTPEQFRVFVCCR